MDEKTIRGLERLVDQEQAAVDSLERQFPTAEIRHLPREKYREVDAVKQQAWRDLENAKTKLAGALAAFETEQREKNEESTARGVTANERMAVATEAAAKASADAARWAKWAAIFTAVAALGTLIGELVQVVWQRKP